MAQSDIQSLLQNLTGVHTDGQAWVPSSVNNGNPNTAYNNSPATVVPFVPPQPVIPHQPVIGHNQAIQKGYIPPTSNTQGDWLVNMPANATDTNWKKLDAQGQGVGMPAGWAGWGNLNDTGKGWLPGTSGVGTPNPPGSPGTGTGGTGGGPQTGGNLPPQQGQPGGGKSLLRPGDGYGGAYSGQHGLSLLDLPAGSFSLSPTGNTNIPSSSASSPAGWGGMSTTDIQGALSSGLNLGTAGVQLAGTPIGKALGITANGGISLGQILDYVIPGNVYMSQTGKLNLLSAIPGILSKINPLLGVAATAAMKWLALHTPIKALKNWLKRLNDNKAAANGGGNDKNGTAGTGGGGAYGSGFGGGGFMGGSYGWGGGLGRVEIGGSGPGEIGDVGTGNGTLGGYKVYQK